MEIGRGAKGVEELVTFIDRGGQGCREWRGISSHPGTEQAGPSLSRFIDGFIEVFIWQGAVVHGNKTEISAAIVGGFVGVDLAPVSGSSVEGS